MPGCPYDKPPPLVLTGSRAAWGNGAVLHEATAFAFRAEPQVFEEEQGGDGEGVVDLDDVDVARPEPGHRIRLGA
jgi:hypothetical protein